MSLKSAIVKGDNTELDLMTLNFTGHVNWVFMPAVFMCTGLLSRRAAAVGIWLKESWTVLTDICRAEEISRLGICNPAQEPAVGIWQEQVSVKMWLALPLWNHLVFFSILYLACAPLHGQCWALSEVSNTLRVICPRALILTCQQSLLHVFFFSSFFYIIFIGV